MQWCSEPSVQLVDSFAVLAVSYENKYLRCVSCGKIPDFRHFAIVNGHNAGSPIWPFG